MERCPSAPQFFKCDGATIELHMDDFHGEGDYDELVKIKEFLVKEVLLKHCEIVKFGENVSYSHLRRERKLVDGDLYIREDPKHVVGAARLMKLSQSVPVPTPLVDGDRNDRVYEEGQGPAELEDKRAKRYRKVAGMLLYYGHGRGDLQFAIRLLCKDLRHPTEESWARLKRVVKYAYHTRGLWTWFRAGGDSTYLVVFTDSDWAGDKKSRKSVGCAVVTWNGTVLAVIVRGQKVVAQSSGEAEFYAAVSGAKEAFHMQQLLAWCGFPLKVVLRTDSSACRGTMARQGVGRQRHLQVQTLWVQQEVKSGRLVLGKVSGSENMADIGTKPLGKTLFEKFRGMLGLQTLEDKS